MVMTRLQMQMTDKAVEVWSETGCAAGGESLTRTIADGRTQARELRSAKRSEAEDQVGCRNIQGVKRKTAGVAMQCENGGVRGVTKRSVVGESAWHARGG